MLLDAITADQRCSTPDAAPRRADLTEVVRAVLDVPDADLDYAEAKLAFDALVDPACDGLWVRCELEALTGKARALANGDTRSSVKIAAIRTLLHKAGPWNDHRPFAYDMDDPEGRAIPGKLLHTYLRTRLGQCVSMRHYS